MKATARIFWLMLDGVGIDEGKSNPFARQDLPCLESLGIAKAHLELSETRVVKSIDACLGVPGLPQSGTGQTTLLTGINAAQTMNAHYGPWPGPSLKPLLEQDSVFVRVANAGGTIALCNHYPETYLRALQTGKHKLNAIAYAATLAGASLGAGIPPMLAWPAQDAPLQHNNDAIRAWAKTFVASQATINVFDAWWSDHLGHRGTLQEAQGYAARLEVFCAAVLSALPSDALFVVTSDHGNVENMGVKTHTFAPVPLAALGLGAWCFEDVQDLMGVAPAMLAALGL